MSSLRSFVVGVYVARSLGAADFGMFSLAWVTFGVVLNISRGLATDPLVVRFSGVATETWRAAVARMTGTAVTVGVVFGALSVLIGLVLGDLGGAFVALGIVMPALLLQDAWRFAFFASGDGRKAFTNDLVWCAALAPAVVVAVQLPSVAAFVLAWGLSCGVAAVHGCVQAKVLPRPSEMRAWLGAQRDLAARYLVENVSLSGAGQIRMYGLGAIAGLADVGAVRGAELLLGPFFALLMGLGLVAVPEAARVLQRAPRKLPVFCALLGGGQAVAALIWGLALLFLLPDSIGHELLGEVWPAAFALVLPAMLGFMNTSVATGAAAGLRALGAARRSLAAQLVGSTAYVVLGVGGAVLDGARGSAWGCAVATLIGATMTWVQLRAGLRDHLANQPLPQAAPEDVTAAQPLP